MTKKKATAAKPQDHLARLERIETAARALMKNAGGLLVSPHAFRESDGIMLSHQKAHLVALYDALEARK